MPARASASASAECRLVGPGDQQLDTRPDREVARRAATEWSVLSVDELYACGLSPTAVAGRVLKGHLHPMYRGVYAVGHAKPPLEGFFLAAVKACGHSTLLSHYAATAHWNMLPWDARILEVTVIGSATSTHEAIRVHRTGCLDPL
jgi:hypothetical protein